MNAVAVRMLLQDRKTKFRPCVYSLLHPNSCLTARSHSRAPLSTPTDRKLISGSVSLSSRPGERDVPAVEEPS